LDTITLKVTCDNTNMFRPCNIVILNLQNDFIFKETPLISCWRQIKPEIAV